MPDREVNIPLLRKAVEWAEAEAAKPVALCEWNQGMWVAPATDSEREQWGTRQSTANYRRAPECGTCYCIAGYVVAQTVGPMPVWQIRETAAAELGISLERSDRLFNGDNTIKDVRRIAEEIAGERL